MEMRGLHAFITDLRKAAAQSKEAEQQRIDKELHHIRQKFKEQKALKGYDKKKYVCKLLYIFMLGYEVDFGHMQGIELLSGDKYSEKHIGYLAITIFLNERHELMTIVTQSVKKDLTGNKEFTQCLALTAVANVGGKDFADAMMDDVAKIALSRETRSMVKKKALLTLLRLYRRSPERIDPEEIAFPIIEELGRVDLGIVNAALSLILGLISKFPLEFAGAVPKCIRLLSKITVQKETAQEYIYYGVPAPWVQVKAFRILQVYPMPTVGTLRNQVTTVLSKIITSSERMLKDQQASKQRATPARSNASNAVLTEAINTVIHWDCDRELLNHSANILGRYITDTKDTNLRYIGLELMSRLSFCGEVFYEHIKKYQVAIVNSLKDPDISIRRKALDLLYVMCDKSNAGEIVGELIDHLPVSEHQIREDLVIKIAILAEKFAVSYSWYVDVIMRVIQEAGSYVSADVWQRVVQIVTNNEDVQKQAARVCMGTLATLSAHETCVKVGSHILGEFGYLIQDEPRCSPVDQFNALHTKYALVGNETRALLLNAYAKMFTMFQSSESKSLQPNTVICLTPSVMADRCNPQGSRDADPRFVATVLSKLQGDVVRLRWHTVEEGGPPPGLTLPPQETKAWLDGEGGSAIFGRPTVVDPRDGYRDVRAKVRTVLEDNIQHMDPEIQQRACEYAMLTNATVVPEQTIEAVLENMPPFSMANTARVFENVIQKGTDTTDANVWQQKWEERERATLAEMRAEQEQRKEEEEDWRQLLVPIQTIIPQAAAARGLEGGQEDSVRQWAASQAALLQPPAHGDVVLHGMVLDQLSAILSQVEAYAPADALPEINAYAEKVRTDAGLFFPNHGTAETAPAPAPAPAPYYFGQAGHFYTDPSYEPPREVPEPRPDTPEDEHRPQGDEVRPPQPQRHCVVAMKVPRNISQRTLVSVFTKFSPDHKRSYVKGWIRHAQADAPREMTEAQVVFSDREHAQVAVGAETGRVVDGERIVCTYAAEAYVVTATPADLATWATVSPDAATAELREAMGAHGAVDQLHTGPEGYKALFYTCSSALDAIATENGATRMGTEWKLELAPNSRWPCMRCGSCNSCVLSACSQCRASRAAVVPSRWWECVRRAVAEGSGYNPYDGCGASPQSSTDRRSSGDSN
eukprot:Hpha_TRINITY_DN16867_c2_g1::TRINITY_DN16867_c2_g1_i8::g.149188::m.149188/K11824/AP2A; AP-2 complex subunit alpha